MDLGKAAGTAVDQLDGQGSECTGCLSGYTSATTLTGARPGSGYDFSSALVKQMRSNVYRDDLIPGRPAAEPLSGISKEES